MDEDSHTSLEGESSTSKAHIYLVSNEEYFTASDSNVHLIKNKSDNESRSSSSESSSYSSALVDSDDSVKDIDYVPESKLFDTTANVINYS